MSGSSRGEPPEDWQRSRTEPLEKVLGDLGYTIVQPSENNISPTVKGGSLRFGRRSAAWNRAEHEAYHGPILGEADD